MVQTFRFDFGTGASPVESGYTEVHHATAYAAATGYGWSDTTGLDSRDRGAPDDLKRDFVFDDVDHTFQVDVTNGDYKVTVIMGDNDFQHDNQDVYAEGILVIEGLDNAVGEFIERVFYITVADGQLNLLFHDDGGIDVNWGINSVVIEELGTPAISHVQHKTRGKSS